MQFVTLDTLGLNRFFVKVDSERQLMAVYRTLIERLKISDKGFPWEQYRMAAYRISRCGTAWIDVRFISGFCFWQIHLHDSSQPMLECVVDAKDLHRFLMQEYVLFDGTHVSSRQEVDRYLYCFKSSEFSHFLESHNLLDNFKNNLLSSYADGWAVNKIVIESPFKDYCAQRTYHDVESNYFIAKMISSMPFVWQRTDEGIDIWASLSDEWRKHIAKVFRGEIRPYTTL